MQSGLPQVSIPNSWAICPAHAGRRAAQPIPGSERFTVTALQNGLGERISICPLFPNSSSQVKAGQAFLPPGMVAPAPAGQFQPNRNQSEAIQGNPGRKFIKPTPSQTPIYWGNLQKTFPFYPKKCPQFMTSNQTTSSLSFSPKTTFIRRCRRTVLSTSIRNFSTFRSPKIESLKMKNPLYSHACEGYPLKPVLKPN
jgi:hypothetical protein